MKFRTLAVILALGCSLTAVAEAKTVRRGAPVYKVKKQKNKSAKAHKVKPAVRQSRKTVRRKH